MKEINRISFLLTKFKQGQLSPEEKTELLQWAEGDPAYLLLLEEFRPDAISSDIASFVKERKYPSPISNVSFESIRAKINVDKPKSSKYWSQVALVAAAIGLIILGSVITLQKYRSTEVSTLLSSMSPTAMPAGSRALLTSSSGQLFNLNETDGLSIDGESLTFWNKDGETESIGREEQLTLIVPKGGAYQVKLDDGTLIKMNANSMLIFPAHFAMNERRVYLEGEAFFDVSKDKNRPFIVANKQQEIKVLGTEFNLKSYPDDLTAKTVLFEGHVQVKDLTTNSQIDLFPGEQTLTGGNIIQLAKEKANLGQAAAWRKGLFSFKSTPFVEVIKEVSRWYNVEVEFLGDVPRELFSGEVNRNVDFGVMFEFLKGSGINLEIKGNKLIIK